MKFKDEKPKEKPDKGRPPNPKGTKPLCEGESRETREDDPPPVDPGPPE